DRDLDLTAGGTGAAIGQVHHRLVDHAAEAQPRRGRTGTCEDRPGDWRAERAFDRDEGPSARLSKGHEGRQAGRDGSVRRAVARDPEMTGMVLDLVPDEARMKVAAGEGYAT